MNDEDTVTIKFGIHEVIALLAVCERIAGDNRGIRGIFSNDTHSLDKFLYEFLESYIKRHNLNYSSAHRFLEIHMDSLADDQIWFKDEDRKKTFSNML